MTLGIRKSIVLALVGGVFLLANLLAVANWLDRIGVVEAARNIREQFLTGTAITVVLALLILLVSPRVKGAWMLRRCPVCDHRITRDARYCLECGSRL